MQIRLDVLRDPAIHALLGQPISSMHARSPPHGVHALDLSALRKPGITFLTAWSESWLPGCGALKGLDRRHGQVKSMRTAAAQLRKGVARAILTHIAAIARGRGYATPSPEPGYLDAFAPARRLCERFGFTYCAAWTAYVEDPNNVFMTLRP
jgi:putative acetyltransferase